MFNKIIAEKRRNKDGTWPDKWTVCSIEKFTDEQYKKYVEGRPLPKIETATYKRGCVISYYYA